MFFRGVAATDQQSQPLREIPGADNNTQILMAPGQSCCALAVLLAIVNLQHGGEDRSQGSPGLRGRMFSMHGFIYLRRSLILPDM